MIVTRVKYVNGGNLIFRENTYIKKDCNCYRSNVIVEMIISLSMIRLRLLVLKDDWIIRGCIYGYQN